MQTTMFSTFLGLPAKQQTGSRSHDSMRVRMRERVLFVRSAVMTVVRSNADAGIPGACHSWVNTKVQVRHSFVNKQVHVHCARAAIEVQTRHSSADKQV